jgi:hypothetical protein
MRKVLPVLAACLLAGCCKAGYQGCDLGAARQAVVGSIDSMGGIDRWRSVDEINATAIVTTYDEKGQAFANSQQQSIALQSGVITASAQVGMGGQWHARINADGSADWDATGVADSAAMAGREADALRAILHRVRGPLNLCLYGEKPAGAGKVDIGGHQYIRVPVEPNKARIMAYYFDAQTYALAMVTAGADAAGKQGTITIYSYQMLPNGLAFPAHISIFKIGQHVLKSDEPVLEVEFKGVTTSPK